MPWEVDVGLMMQSRLNGLFGNSADPRSRGPARVYRGPEDMPPLPGPISGYGGGTWNIDGTQATPVDRLGEGIEGMMQPIPGAGASAVGWDQTETDMPLQSFDPKKRRGLFGSHPQPPLSSPESGGEGQPAWSVSAMGAPLDASSLPRRQSGTPFDYDAALASMLPEQRKRSTFEKIASIAAPALMGFAGNQAGANAFIANQQGRRDSDQRQRSTALSQIERWKHDDFARQSGADLRASAPRVIGRSMVQYDPQSGGVDELYDGPEDFETFAETQGLEPGTQEYFDAVQDYVLKGDGPAAYDRDKGLDDYRTGNRLKLEGARQGNRVGLEGIRQNNRVTTRGLPTYRDTHPRAGGSKRPTATGPNGEKVEFDGTAWVPAR